MRVGFGYSSALLPAIERKKLPKGHDSTGTGANVGYVILICIVLASI